MPERTALATSNATTAAGSGAALFFGALTPNEVAAFGGLLVAIAGLVANIYFQRRRDAREQALWLLEAAKHGSDNDAN